MNSLQVHHHLLQYYTSRPIIETAAPNRKNPRNQSSAKSPKPEYPHSQKKKSPNNLEAKAPNPNKTQGLFGWQNFWRNATVAVSLLFGKYCPIMV
jgi:hypothetical protein